MFKTIESFLFLPVRTLWMVVDYFTPESIKFRRIISRVNTQTRILQRSIDRIDQCLVGIIDTCKNNVHKAEILYEQPNHDLATMKYYATQITIHRERINRLTNTKARFELFKTQILDQIHNAVLARSLREVGQILKDINDFNEDVNSTFNIEEYNMESMRANETTIAIDGAISTAQQNTVVNIEHATDDTVASVITEIADRVHQKRNQNNGAIEVHVVSNSNNPICDQQLEERFNKLCSNNNNN